MKRFQMSKEEYEAIKAAEKATEDKNVSKRLRVLMLRYEGYSVIEVAKIMGINRSTFYLLYKRYKEEGLERFAQDRKSTRLNSSHPTTSRMPSSA